MPHILFNTLLKMENSLFPDVNYHGVNTRVCVESDGMLNQMEPGIWAAILESVKT